MLKNIKNFTIILILPFILVSCAKDKNAQEDTVLKKKRFEPNMEKRIKEEVEKKSIFSMISKGSGNYEFATSNVLWRATLKTIDFIPLQSANYSGGLVITDWYSNSLTSKESLKIEVRFYSSELSSNSFEVKSYKKICSGENRCQTKKGDPAFNSEIKNRIITEARKISLSKTKKN